MASMAGGNSGRSLYGRSACQVIFKVLKFIDTRSFFDQFDVDAIDSTTSRVDKNRVFLHNLPEVPCVGRTDENDCDSITVPEGTVSPRNCGCGCPGIWGSALDTLGSVPGVLDDPATRGVSGTPDGRFA